MECHSCFLVVVSINSVESAPQLVASGFKLFLFRHCYQNAFFSNYTLSAKTCSNQMKRGRCCTASNRIATTKFRNKVTSDVIVIKIDFENESFEFCTLISNSL